MEIYKLTNTTNGKFYIGKTEKSTQSRWKTHLADYKKGRTKLYNAMKKYGVENFVMECIEYTGPVDREYLNSREIYWIAKMEPEYNMTKGGDGGWIHDQTGKTWKVKDTSRMGGKKTVTPKVIAARQLLKGGNNYQSKYFIHTPWGTFETWIEAIAESKRAKEAGEVNIITSEIAIQRYCLNNVWLNPEGRRTPKDWRGKYTRDLGFFIEEKK